ncbi:MAG: DUF4834 family protein [Prevotella sp.]|nr:DUF4834 family protein [Prevotella sp.]
MFILKFILILFIAFIILVGAGVWRLFSSINNARKQFQDLGRQKGTGYQTRNANDKEEVIVDQRPPEEVNRKIIPRDEGEYVDYEDA